jgi:predicted ribosomally synthesized peptide with nif11-like leader
MAAGDVSSFFVKVAQDKALQGKLAAIEGKAKANAGVVLADVIQLAAEAGFAFSAQDLLAARTEARDLSPAEIQAVRGEVKSQRGCDYVSQQVWCDGNNVGMWGCFPMQWM